MPALADELELAPSGLDQIVASALIEWQSWGKLLELSTPMPPPWISEQAD